MKRRFLPVILAIILVSLIFLPACGGEGEPAETTAKTGSTTAATTAKTDAPTTTTEATTEAETEPQISLDGYEFTLVAGHIGKFTPQVGLNELNDRWLRAYIDIQDKYDFRLSLLPGSVKTETIMTYVTSNQKWGDFVAPRHSDFFPLSVAGYLKPLDGDELVKAGFNAYDETRWDQHYTQLSKFNDQIWAVLTNGEFNVAVFGYVLGVNDHITSPEGYDKAKLYEIVRAKEWTWEKYLDIARAVTKDTTGDGEQDQFGSGSWVFGSEILTNGYMPINLQNGKWTADFTNPWVIEGLEFLQDWQESGIVRAAESGNGNLRKMFVAGDVAFSPFYHGHLIEPIFEECEFEYGLIPLPMGPRAETYVHIVPDLDAWCMLSTNKDYEKSIIAMNAWGEIMTNDGWHDSAREVFRDDESWDIFLELILPNTILNNLKITDPIWKYYQDNMSNPVRLGEVLPSMVSEQHNEVIQQMLDDSLNK